MSDDKGDLTRVTVNLTPRALAAMEAMSRKTRLGKTDVINRALQVYALVDSLVQTTRDDGALVVVNDFGEQQRIYIL